MVPSRKPYLSETNRKIGAVRWYSGSHHRLDTGPKLSPAESSISPQLKRV